MVKYSEWCFRTKISRRAWWLGTDPASVFLRWLGVLGMFESLMELQREVFIHHVHFTDGETVWPAFWQIVPPGKFPHGRWVQMGERLWRILWERKSIWTLTKGSTVCVSSILRQFSSNSHDQQKSTWGGSLPGVFQHLVSLPCKSYFNFIVLLALLGLCWGMWAFFSCFAQA